MAPYVSFPRSFMVSSFHVQDFGAGFCVWWELRVQFHSFACDGPVCPTPFIGRDCPSRILAHCILLAPLLWIGLTTCMAYFWVLYFAPLIYGLFLCQIISWYFFHFKYYLIDSNYGRWGFHLFHSPTPSHVSTHSILLAQLQCILVWSMWRICIVSTIIATSQLSYAVYYNVSWTIFCFPWSS